MKRISLTQHLVEQQRQHNSIPAELRLLIEVVARACKTISHSVGKGALGDVLGTARLFGGKSQLFLLGQGVDAG